MPRLLPVGIAATAAAACAALAITIAAGRAPQATAQAATGAAPAVPLELPATFPEHIAGLVALPPAAIAALGARALAGFYTDPPSPPAWQHYTLAAIYWCSPEPQQRIAAVAAWQDMARLDADALTRARRTPLGATLGTWRAKFVRALGPAAAARHLHPF